MEGSLSPALLEVDKIVLITAFLKMTLLSRDIPLRDDIGSSFPYEILYRFFLSLSLFSLVSEKTSVVAYE